MDFSASNPVSLAASAVGDPDADKPKKKRKIEMPIVPIKNTADYQRMKLERLMANPDKPVAIPERPREKKGIAPPPDFVRNIMGSSAGAGSGEFHVYRHLRRKEYARQKSIQDKAEYERKEDEHTQRLEEAKKLAESKTAKKRAKRQKQKERMKQNKMKQKLQGGKTQNKSSSSEDSDDSEGEKEEEPKQMEPEDRSKSDEQKSQTTEGAPKPESDGQ